MIRVLLADDQALIRAGFHVLIDAADDLQVVGEAIDGAQAVDLARRERADVVLMDIRMPGVDGLEATRRISADDDLAGVKVIILTTFESDEYVYQAIRAGASGFLVKDTEPADLIQAVRVVARGARPRPARRHRVRKRAGDPGRPRPAPTPPPVNVSVRAAGTGKPMNVGPTGSLKAMSTYFRPGYWLWQISRPPGLYKGASCIRCS